MATSQKQPPLHPYPLLLLLLLLNFFLIFILLVTTNIAAAPLTLTVVAAQEIQRGFSVTPGPIFASSSSSSFQPLLSDPSGNFSLGFLLVGSDQLDLAVLHLPSSLAVWRATPARPARWSGTTSLSFNGSLVLSDLDAGVIWSTQTEGAGDRLLLLNSSNLQIQKKLTDGHPANPTILWQSFSHPSDTLVQDQNFTTSAALFSSDGRFSMRLGPNDLALYMDFKGNGLTEVMYWKHTALEAKAQIVQGEGTIYARVDSLGFLGMYQNERAPVDVMSFDSFNRPSIVGLRRLTLESDGNLRGYYWNGSIWVSEFVAISDRCELPTSCGAYGLCQVRGKADGCGCLDNRTTGSGCFPPDSGDLCGVGDGFWALRREGVDLAYKELLLGGSEKLRSLEECEGSCERNCSCWGAVYNNASGFCYKMDFPIQTLVGADKSKMGGYFKVRIVRGSSGGEKGISRKALLLLLLGAAGIFVAIAGLGAYRVWKSRRGGGNINIDGSDGEGLSAGPYKDLKQSSSFRSIELSPFSFRK